MTELIALVPPEGLKILITLFLCFLIGLEREEHKASSYSFGGVRTFPIIGLIGYGLSLLSGSSYLPLSVGFLVIGGFLLLSFWHKLVEAPSAGITTEVSALMTYLLGALVQRDFYWIAATLVVISMLLLTLKRALEGLSTRIAGDEILSFTKFLLLAAVILPAVPNRDYTSFQLNPYRTWLVVVAVSGVSYAGYALQRLFTGRGGVLTTALVGGAYSSTVTTVTLAKKSRDAGRPHLFSGSILMASGMMYLRLIALLWLFNKELFRILGPAFAGLAAVALLGGAWWAHRPDPGDAAPTAAAPPKNPLELDAAFIFAGLFVAILIATHLVVQYLGNAGVFGLAGIMGLTDVDPFIMGMTQTAGADTAMNVAAAAIAIAAASNNVAKGGYAFAFADRDTGRSGLLLLLGLAALGLLPLIRLGLG
jgi:uncharacterized membrane protein (DUF4010 family)